MNRAERRIAQKSEQKVKITTCNLSKAQLDALVREKISDELDRVKRETHGLIDSIICSLLLTLSFEVLMGEVDDSYGRQKKCRGLQRSDSLQCD